MVQRIGAASLVETDEERPLCVFRRPSLDSSTTRSLGMLNTWSRGVQEHPSNAQVEYEPSSSGEAVVSSRSAAGSSGTEAKASSNDTLSRRIKKIQTLEVERRHKREYMRQWRAHPRNRTKDWTNRLKWHYQRKLRSALGSGRVTSAKAGRAPLCGFCHLLPAITTVKRLKCCEFAMGGYVEELVLYCGEC